MYTTQTNRPAGTAKLPIFDTDRELAQYLAADGTWDSDKAVLLCVLGIRPDGTRHILGKTPAKHKRAVADGLSTSTPA